MDIIDVLNNLIEQPPEIINLVISFIPNPFLPIFLDCDALALYVLPIIFTKVRIQEDYYKLNDPIRFFNPDDYNDSPIVDLMEDLVHMVTKFGVFPKELEIKAIYRPPPDLKMIIVDDDGNDVNYENHLALKTLVRNYKELLKKVEVVYFPDLMMNSRINDLKYFSENQIAIGSVTDFSENDDGEFLKNYPNNIKSIILPAYNFNESNIIKGFTNLKILLIHSADLRIFQYLPSSIESLGIVNLHTTNGCNNHATPILSKLKKLHVGIEYANEFRYVTNIFPNLELFILKSLLITDLDDLCLPIEIRTIKFVLCPKLTNYLGLKKFFKLKILDMLDSPFPLGLFDCYEQCPKLTEFRSYYPPTSKGIYVHKLDQMKFPKTLKVLELVGNFQVEA